MSSSVTFDPIRRLACEFVGTGFLLATVVGSGIMGDRLADGNVAIALLANTVATAAILFVLIESFGRVSGAHFNPAVTLAFWMDGEIGTGEALRFVAAQVVGGLLGVLVAHGMYEMPLLQVSTTVRAGPGQMLAEGVATFGLVLTIFAVVRARPAAVAAAVAAFITAGYWFTASTSFANPAVTIARMFTDTFSGIRAIDAPAFVACQFLGAALAASFCRWLFVPESRT